MRLALNLCLKGDLSKALLLLDTITEYWIHTALTAKNKTLGISTKGILKVAAFKTPVVQITY